ncbi:DUF5681 domain-containing protein [Sphingomonas sp. RB1R13]|uniref:DUF5681 domain-containing protein n=1 Tax=Sphingomonas sp. RB1R13 TaxID=3096159 RepID=UPI002FCB0B80
MTDDPKAYTVGFRRPPEHSRFKPGQSGNPAGRKNRRKMREAEIVAMVRDEPIEIMLKGKKVKVSMFEATLRRTYQCVLTKGSVRELEKLLELCAKFGALPADFQAEEARRGAESVMQKIRTIFDRTVPDDDEDVVLV